VSRAVVFGPYPPTAEAAGAATLAEVRALRAAGHDVLVISPEPSAARSAALPTTRRGARRIARLLRGADVAVWVGAHPPPVVERALRAIDDVRTVTVGAAPVEPASVNNRMRLLRAGAPTFLRTLRPRRP
jgi:hypothetical protein